MRYSRLLFPIQIIGDLGLILICMLLTVNIWSLSLSLLSVISVLIAWVISLYVSGRYRVRRFTRIPNTVVNLTRLSFVFVGANVLSFQFFFREDLYLKYFATFHSLFYVGIVFSRIIMIRLIKRYRSLGNNYRNVLIVGISPDTKRLAGIFSDSNELGYRLKQMIDGADFTLERFKKIVELDEIHELFVSALDFDEQKFAEIVEVADNLLVKIRVVPNFSGFFSSNLKLDYVGFQPVLVHRQIALDDFVNSSIKRLFDIIFALLVIVGILSWLFPILAIAIKIESKGPVLFRQKRSGINNQDFWCLKFRSMAVNDDSNFKQATKNDARVTKIGRFIRETSIDELPQFLNVLMGDMSVVGPRPHMLKHTMEFANIVDRYMLRHMVKPGITGLAQTMGYRGETKTNQELKGRITLDRFYIENWNFFLDLKIIYKTIINALTGEEGAY